MDMATSIPAAPQFVPASQAARPLAIEARGLVKRFDKTLAVDGVDIVIPEGAIYGILGPNGAGKTTTLRMLLGIIEPDAGYRRVLGADDPQDVARRIGYLPEERGLYPSMKCFEAIDKQIRQLSKGMAQTVQLLGTLVHDPALVVFDEPFSGLDAINQGKLEALIRGLAERGTTVIFSTHVIAHAERLCEGIAIIAGGKVPFAGLVDEARDRIPAQVRLETRNADGPWRAALPAAARREGDFWYFPLPESGVEPLLKALIDGEAGILSLSIERAGLHDAFVAIAGEAAARDMVAQGNGEPA
jgi:ABC-2 type transport system ATP-binding protein